MSAPAPPAATPPATIMAMSRPTPTARPAGTRAAAAAATTMAGIAPTPAAWRWPPPNGATRSTTAMCESAPTARAATASPARRTLRRRTEGQGDVRRRDALDVDLLEPRRLPGGDADGRLAHAQRLGEQRH